MGPQVALAAQVVLGHWLLALNLYTARQYWSMFGGGRQYSALYGIWEVTQMSIEDQPLPPLLTDNTRWRRAIFDFPQQVALQRMDDSLAYYGATINLTDKTLILTKRTDKNWRANLTLQRPVQDSLIVDGRMEDHAVHIELRLRDRNKIPAGQQRFSLDTGVCV